MCQCDINREPKIFIILTTSYFSKPDCGELSPAFDSLITAREAVVWDVIG